MHQMFSKKFLYPAVLIRPAFRIGKSVVLAWVYHELEMYSCFYQFFSELERVLRKYIAVHQPVYQEQVPGKFLCICYRR